MTQSIVTAEFQKSYKDQNLYPTNLLDKSHTNTDLGDCHAKLDDPQSHFCQAEDSSVLEVNFKDFHTGRPSQEGNVRNERSLTRWLHHQDNLPDSVDDTTFQRRDPVCRFTFLTAANGRARLKISKKMLFRLFSFHQVPSEYVTDLTMLFGQRSGPSDLRYKRFSTQISLGAPVVGLEMPELGRSGHHYELCYNLRTGIVKRDDPADPPEWSIRHAAVYHKFDVITGHSTWFVTQARDPIRKSITKLTSDSDSGHTTAFGDPVQAYKSSLEMHLVIAKSEFDQWSKYLRALEEILSSKIKALLLEQMDLEKSTAKGHRKLITEPETLTKAHLQEVLMYENKNQSLITSVEGNIETLEQIKVFYEDLMFSPKFATFKTAMFEEATESFSHRVSELIERFRRVVQEATDFRQDAADCKSLILQLLQAQAADEMTSMTRRSIKEAIAMRIITVVTLVYLPATFVSTFFSTDVVKYQPGGDGQNETYHTQYSSLAMNRWLQVTLPLTAVTLMIAGLAYWLARRPLKHTRPKKEKEEDPEKGISNRASDFRSQLINLAGFRPHAKVPVLP